MERYEFDNRKINASRRICKIAAIILSAAIISTSAGISSLAADDSVGASSSQNYSVGATSAVFYVDTTKSTVGASDMWNTPLTEKLFDSSKGSSDIANLQVPTLAYDDTSIGLVWSKPEKYDNVADYNVYINGVKQPDTARQNFDANADWASVYMKAFYDYYKDNVTTIGGNTLNMVKVDIHSYRATGLKPDTEYSFKVVAIDKDGKELGSSQTITQKTAKTPEIFNVKDFGAVESEGYTYYNDEINAFIVKNTKAIQAAIDACTPGGKVVIPEGTFVSGALWLKSNMTLEINGTLWSSPNSDHFEIGFLMYPFYTDTRCWGIINAVSSDPEQQLENIRITGKGSVFGNGWKYVDGSASGSVEKKTYKKDGDVDATKAGFEKYALPQNVGGGNAKVFSQGVLAADSAIKYLANLTDDNGAKRYGDSIINSLRGMSDTNITNTLKAASPNTYSNDLTNAYATRSSLVILRNINGVYIDDIIVANPSNHSINVLDSDNIAVNNVKVLSYDCNNGDGIGVGCSKNVTIWNNFLDTGDDSIGFGSSVGKGAQDCNIQSNSNIWVFDNYLHEGHGGAIAAGSHTANGIENILCEDNVMNHTDMPFRFKSAPTTGGYISNITMRDCAVADCDQAFVLTTSYGDPNSASVTEYADVPGTFNNFKAYNISVFGVRYNTIQVLADINPIDNTEKPLHTHYNLYFQDITFGNVGGNGSFKNQNGWDTLNGCENAIFYNFKTISYNSSSVSKGTDVAWSNIKFCKNIQFLGTTLDTLNASKTNMDAASVVPGWSSVTKVTAVSADDGKSVTLEWDAAKASSGNVIYGVDTYVGDVKVQTVDGLSSNSAKISGLSAGVDYKFKIYASVSSTSKNDKANCYAIVNKTEGPTVSFATYGELDKTAIAAPSSADVILDNPVYTCARARWTPAETTDSRVSGYRIYVNGALNKTVYRWQMKKDSEGKYNQQVGRLTPGIENDVKIVAFTDSGVEFNYNTAKITTLKNYDFKSPSFASDAKLNAIKNNSGDVILSWDAATDDTAVGGYRLYIDGKPVYANEGDVFNPVNGKYTTAATTYAISGLDLTKDHTFTVQAGDTWWRAATTMGTYDKLAGFNWTVKGLTATLKAGSAQNPADDNKNNSPSDNSSDSAGSISSGGRIGGGATAPVYLFEAVDKIATAANGTLTVVNMNPAEPAVSATLFEDIKGRDAEVQLNFGSFIWGFNGKDIKDIPNDRVFYNMGVQKISEKEISAAAGESEVIQIELAHNGLFPCNMSLTFNVGSNLSGKTVYLNYFNEKTGKLEPTSSGIVDQYGNATFILPHASKYVVTTYNVAGATVEQKQPSKKAAASGGGKPNINTGSPLMALEAQTIIDNPTPYIKSAAPEQAGNAENSIENTQLSSGHGSIAAAAAILAAAVAAGAYFFIKRRKSNIM